MIVDQLHSWNKYFSHSVWKTIFDELCALHEMTPQGERQVSGKDVILKVFSYCTLDVSDDQSYPESHRQYLDIHTTLRQSERIEWYPASALTPVKPYDALEDEIVYARPPTPSAGLIMTPGLFALFAPEDAHRPRLHPAGTPMLVKKAVMKVSSRIAF